MGWWAAGACTLAWLAALSAYDLTRRRLPNALTLTGAAVVLAVAVLTGRGGPAAVGAVALVVPYLGVHLAAPRAMGAGDVKLAIGIGGLTGACGADVWLLAALAAPVLTGLWGIAVAVRRAGPAADVTVPHGLSMCLTASVAAAPAFL